MYDIVKTLNYITFNTTHLLTLTYVINLLLNTTQLHSISNLRLRAQCSPAPFPAAASPPPAASASTRPKLSHRDPQAVYRAAHLHKGSIQHDFPQPALSLQLPRAAQTLTPPLWSRKWKRSPTCTRPSSISPSSSTYSNCPLSLLTPHLRSKDLIPSKSYGTARDEFEIAAEETAKKTVYAEDDRSAAREELEKLKEAYKHVVEGNDKGVAEEVKRRVGNRVRELESAVVAMEEAALEE